MKTKALITVILYVLGGLLIFIGSLLKITHKGGDFFLSAGIGLNALFFIGILLLIIAYFTGRKR